MLWCLVCVYVEDDYLTVLAKTWLDSAGWHVSTVSGPRVIYLLCLCRLCFVVPI
jgi:hypothetical protein